MSWYRVRLNGQNFLLNIQGKARKYGFYTTRGVEADSFEAAQLKALKFIRDEDFLKTSTVNDRNDSPMIYVEEIRILESKEERLENSGHTFYTEDENS